MKPSSEIPTKPGSPAIRTASAGLKDLQPGKFQTLRKIEQGGALQARKLGAGGIQFYWRYTHEGKTDRVAIGTFDATAPPKSLSPTSRGFSIAAAAEACRKHALIQQQTQATGGYREHLASLKREHESTKAESLRAEQETLLKLLDTYCDHLESTGRRSHADARSIFALHLVSTWEDIAKRPASALTVEQVTDMLRALISAGKGRTANKLRAYLRAAYQCALDVNSLPSLPASFKAFKLTFNPAAQTKRVASFDKADKRPLSREELRLYWQLIQCAQGLRGAALRLHLLTGGQRIEQLVKLRSEDLGHDALVIYDSKGRPGQGPRRHTVPLTSLAQADTALLNRGTGYAISTDGGKTHLAATTLSLWAREIAGGIPDFQLKQVRSGVETLLASAGVPPQVRGHLQSHGLAGIQARHYDAYDYLTEKTNALATLEKLITSH